MRRVMIPLVLALLIAGCKGNDNSAANTNPIAPFIDSSQFTTIQWLDSTKDFGTIAEGQKLEVSFRFKNTGEHPLLITQVRPSCGCTVAEQPREPIAPGKEGLIRAVFNSQGHTGHNHKTLYVSANARNLSKNPLQFDVDVSAKK